MDAAPLRDAHDADEDGEELGETDPDSDAEERTVGLVLPKGVPDTLADTDADGERLATDAVGREDSEPLALSDELLDGELDE